MSTATQSAPQAAMTLDDIRQLATRELPPLSSQVAPAGAAALGSLAPLRQWLADVQGKAQPALVHPRIALFLSRYGLEGETQGDLHLLSAALAKPAHPLSALARDMNADFQVYELDIDNPSGNPASGNALSEQEAMQALAYGMMAVQAGIDCLALALPNPAVPHIAAALHAAMAQKQDALSALLAVGSFDIAAALGAAIAARLAKAPVILDDSAEIIGEMMQSFGADSAAHIRRARGIIADDMRPQPALRAALALSLLRALAKAA
ncbi:MAG: nicotinate-nucleotide--dimethylbenzimidazole phosphoribosyltransferase [Alphaproteobacteria bacterium]|nr:nicotinate-nucleotide--dimethylbenzimidazole phosphoribosyltransferase [Alphaproteobacteria bacterium]